MQANSLRMYGIVTARWAAMVLMMSSMALSPTTSFADDGNPAYTSAEAAGIDYKIQGEYEGVLGSEGERWGAQVIALGDGKFAAYGCRGGLPGHGWTPGDERPNTEGKLDGDEVVFDAPEFTIHVDGKEFRIESLDGDVVGKLTKVDRKSPTLGAKPPEGATVLFDGTNVDAWVNGKLTEDNYLAATGVESKAKFGDHSLHLEFRTPFMPKSRGQARGNSGMYLQSRYEVQVLDSFGLEGEDNECGGIYSIAKPKVNMCFPPLAWQTYDVDFKAARYDDQGNKTQNARVTIRHNGVVIHDDLELPHGTPGRADEAAGPAPLFLQDHGNPVVYRNIWVVEK